MKTNNMKIKIEKISKVILFWMVAAVAVLTSIDYFNSSWNLANYIAPIFVFGVALFVFAEVGYFEGFKKKDMWRIAGSIFAMLALLGVILEVIPGMPVIGPLETIKGLLSGLLAVYFVIEGLR
jgi:hypothetical protein